MKTLVASLILASGLSYTNSEIVDACFKKNIDMCADLICEGDHEPEAVLKAMQEALHYCFERPDLIGEQYFQK